MYTIKETETFKALQSKSCSYCFNKKTGLMITYGKDLEDNPDYSPFGPFIADIEISTICSGVKNKLCSQCYKGNTRVGKNMSLETFKVLLSKLPDTLTQIAFGIGDIGANPELFDILEHTRNTGIIPNITINGDNLTNEYADKLVNVCGAVAVSRHNREVCYDAVKKLTDKGLKQVNIHMIASNETYDDCITTLGDIKQDSRLSKLTAVVFLTLKPKGSRNKHTPLRDVNKYKNIIEKAFKSGISIGFDSCSAPIFLRALEDNKNYKELEKLAETCESTLFSIYINVGGQVFPCSFLEDSEYKPVDILSTSDFIKDVWFNSEVVKFRDRLLNTNIYDKCRGCPHFEIY